MIDTTSLAFDILNAKTTEQLDIILSECLEKLHATDNPKTKLELLEIIYDGISEYNRKLTGKPFEPRKSKLIRGLL